MAAFRFSTETLPEKDRLAIFIEEFSKTLFKTDVEPLPDTRFVQSATFRRLPGLSIILGSGSAVRCTRTLRHIADSVEHPYFHIHLRGTGQFTQLGRETTFTAREAVLTSGEDAATARFSSNFEALSVCLPQKVLADRLRYTDEAFLRPVPSNNEALRLLTTYLSVLGGADAEHMDLDAVAGLAPAVTEHVYDLIALALGATRDAAEEAKGRGVRAARLHAIKADIMRNLDSDNLAVADVARRHGVSPRYVQMLFAAEGVTFSEHVLGQRLVRVRRMLEEPRFAGRTISAIAYEVGFGDLSHFNRAFRRHFGITPSDVRAAVRSDAKQ
jgi:AraC-like DNA-binding protein